MSNLSKFTEEEVRLIQRLTKNRVELLTHIIIHQQETEAYREGAKEELHQLIHLQHKVDAYVQDVDCIRREQHE